MRRTIVFTIICAFFTFSAVASASGFRLLEVDNVGQGMAHARVAGVDDAAAVYYNPAAMPEVEKYSAKVGFIQIDPKTKLDHADEPDESVNETFPVPHIYSVNKLEDMGISVGFGIFSNFGTGSGWSIESPVRHIATDTKLRTYTVNVSGAMSLDVVSIGLGLNYMDVHAEYDNLYRFPGTNSDGYSLIDATGSSFGFNAGLLFKVTNAIKIGATYRSAMESDLSGKIDLENVPDTSLHGGAGFNGDDYTTDASGKLKFPAIASAGIAINVTDTIAVEFDVDYTQWSALDEITFNFDRPLTGSGGAELLPGSVTEKKNWKDTVTLKLGAAFKIDDNMTFRCGFYNDPSPVPDDTFSPRIPDADRNAVTLGFGYKAADKYTLDASFAYVMTGDRTVSNDVGHGEGNGTYNTTANIFGVSLGYTF